MFIGRMRVLHFTESFSQPTETFIKRYVEKSLQFAEVGVASYHLQNIDDELKRKLNLFEITNRLYTRKSIAGATRYIYENLSGMRLWYQQLDKAIKSFKPDIIHCHFGNAGIAMMNFCNKFKIATPYVTSFYGYDISSLPVTDKRYRRNLDKLWTKAPAFFAEGPELAKKGIALGCEPSKWFINPLLIPVEDYPVKQQYRNTAEPVRFLFVGRFIEKKGLHLFLKAIGQLKQSLTDFTIDIVGSGPYKEQYDEIISENNLTDHVKWLGILKHHEIINMMKDYDFLVHPSLTAKDNDSEGGAPTIIIEAQAVGLPVITSDHADIPYVMGYYDFMAKENDIFSLTVNLKNIIECKDIQDIAKKGTEKALYQHGLIQNDLYESNLRKIIAKS